MEKENEVYTYHVILFSLKGEKKKPSLCENMDEPERHCASGVSQSQKDKYS